MTERVPKLAREAEDRRTVEDLVDASTRPDGAISLTFPDGVVHIMLDHSGDWTITAGLSMFSDRLAQLTRSLEQLGFFHATEQEGMIYHLWTSALAKDVEELDTAENTLLEVLKSFQTSFTPKYIG
jgi:hypothetical protein